MRSSPSRSSFGFVFVVLVLLASMWSSALAPVGAQTMDIYATTCSGSVATSISFTNSTSSYTSCRQSNMFDSYSYSYSIQLFDSASYSSYHNMTITTYTDSYCTNVLNLLTTKSLFFDGSCVTLSNYATAARTGRYIYIYANVWSDGQTIDVQGFLNKVAIAIIVVVCVVVFLCIAIPVAACFGLLTLPMWCGCCPRKQREIVYITTSSPSHTKIESIPMVGMSTSSDV